MKYRYRFMALMMALIYMFSSFSVFASEETTTAAVEENTTVAAENETQTEEETEAVLSPVQTAADYGCLITSDNSPSLSLVGEGVILIEAQTGQVLYEKNANERFYPASITKIMTTLVALENSNLTDEMTFTAETLNAIEAGSSRVGVEAGETCTVEDALYCVMLASGNDAAAGVAEHIGGSVSGFVDMMNAKVEELGLTNTHFENPHGLHSDTHYTTAADMAVITRAAIQNPDFVKIASAYKYDMPKTNMNGKREIWQHHKMLLPGNSDEYDAAVTGKTGFTSMALNTLVTTAEKDGLGLIAVVLHCQGADYTRSDTKQLFDYGFENYTVLKPLESFSLKDAATKSGVSEDELKRLDNLDVLFNGDYSVVAPKGASISDINVSVSTDNAAEGVWGRVVFTYQEKEIGNANIYYDPEDEFASIIKEDTFIDASTTAKIPFILVGIMAVLFFFIIIQLLLMIVRRR